MKVAFFTDSDYYSGAEKVLSLVARGTKFDEKLLVVNPKIASFFRQAAGDMPIKEAASRSKLAAWLLGRHLRLLGRFRPDLAVVNMQTPFANTYFLLAAALLGVRVVTIWHLPQTKREVSGPLRPAKLWAYQLALALSSHIVTVSHWHKKILTEEFGFPREKITMIHNGLEPLRVPPVKKKKNLELVCAGTLEERKGQKILLEALKNIPGEWHLRLIGDGPDKKELEAMVDTLQLNDRVEFTGRTDPQPFFAQADLLVHPARAENLSMVIIEAMSQGVPIIAHEVGGNRELVQDGVNGWLVPLGDLNAWRVVLKEALADRQKLVQFGEASRNRFNEEFSFQRMINGYQNLFAEIAQ